MKSINSFLWYLPICWNNLKILLILGPGHYAPEKYGNISKPGVPAFSFSSRHKHLEIPTHPVGPNQYTVPNTIGHVNYVTNIKNSPAFSISCKYI